jgi:hypothetical protein
VYNVQKRTKLITVICPFYAPGKEIKPAKKCPRDRAKKTEERIEPSFLCLLVAALVAMPLCLGLPGL